MTTPRVTVPVELAERIKSFLLQAREGCKNSGKTKQALEINTMLHGLITAPAAPAPEGGAVRDALREMLALVLLKYGNLDEAVNAAVERAQSALATREEAPERRECDDCGFKGTSDDQNKQQDYCTACGENIAAGGPDECEHCGAKNHMVMACPRCGGRFSLDEDVREEAPADSAHPCYDEHQPGCDCEIPPQSAAPMPSYLERLSAPAEAGERDRIAKIIDPEAFVPMEDVVGMRKAYMKADAILSGTMS